MVAHFDEDWQAVQGLIAVRHARVSLHEVAENVGHGIGWLATLDLRILRYVREQYGMPGSIGPDVQTWQAPPEQGPMVTGEVAE